MDPLRPGVPPTPVQVAEHHYEQGLEMVREARAAPAGEPRRAAFARASGHFTAVLEIDPHYHGARTNLGYCLIEMGRHGDAKPQIEQAIREFPDDASALINYAVILEYNHRSTEAEAYLRRAILVDPRQASAYRDLAYLLEHGRKYRAAADNLDRYLALEPHAHDERAVRQRIKLLRQRSVLFELPDRVVTPWGKSADLRIRAVSIAIDASLWIPLIIWTERIIERLGREDLMGPVWFAVGAFAIQVLAVELFGGTVGHFATRTKVAEAGTATWFSPRALREACRTGPFLLASLCPWPLNAALIVIALVAAVLSALSDPEGRAWFDRLTSTRLVASQGWKSQSIAIAVWVAALTATLLVAGPRLVEWWDS